MTIITIDQGNVERERDRQPGASSRTPFRVRHDLEGTGLLDLARLAALADSLPQASVEHNLGDVPAVLAGGDAPVSPLRPRDIVESIETNGCWMVLKNVEQDPEYAALLNTCLDQIEPAVTAPEGHSVIREGFIFLSAPHSVTPTHIDPEHNVLLQVRGHKTVEIGRFPDDDARDRQVERLHSGEHRNLADAAIGLSAFPLQPGDGVYVPVHAPHLVRNGSVVSISLSVTWGTKQTLRTGRAYGLNARVRGLGRVPRPPGASMFRDMSKALAFRVLGRLARSART